MAVLDPTIGPLVQEQDIGGRKRQSTLIAFVACALVAGGCANGIAIDESVPQAALIEQKTDPGDDGVPAHLSNTDETAIAGQSESYPNLNLAPQSAVAQLSDAEKTAKIAELTAARSNQAAQGAGAASQREVERLRRLARSHGNKALEEIEGEQ